MSRVSGVAPPCPGQGQGKVTEAWGRLGTGRGIGSQTPPLGKGSPYQAAGPGSCVVRKWILVNPSGTAVSWAALYCPGPTLCRPLGSQEGLWGAVCSRFCPLAIFMASDAMVAARLPAVFLPFFLESEFPFPISLSGFKGKY